MPARPTCHRALRGAPIALICALFALLLATPGNAQAAFGFQFKWGANGGGGSPGSGNGEFTRPTGMAYFNGNVFVADQGNNRVQKFTTDGSFVTKWGANGGFPGTGDGEFATPSGVAVDASGDVYVADSDNNRIQKFTNAGAYIDQWGTLGGSGGQFSGPYGVAVDNANSVVYVADQGNSRVQKFGLSGNYISQFSTDLNPGEDSQPTGIAVDSAGHIYVTDVAYHRVSKYPIGGGPVTVQWGAPGGVPGTGDGEFSSPFGVTADAGNKIYVSDQVNNRVQTFTSNGAFIPDGFGSEGAGDGQFHLPIGVATDPFSNVYVADFGNHRIQRFGINAVGGADKGQISLDTTLLFQASPNRVNDVTITLSAGQYTITDDSSPVNAVAPCTVVSANSITCPADGVDLIRVETLDLGDSITINAPTPSVLDGGAEGDVLSGGSGNDTISGGGGTNDTASYLGAASGVTVDVGTAGFQPTDGAGDDKLISIDNLTGSNSGDTLTGDATANTLSGLGGDDTLRGGAGDDLLNGNNGVDTLDYSGAGAGVTVNLAIPIQQPTGGAGNDTISNSENLIGTAQDDTLSGNDAINNISAGDGNDTVGVRDFTADTVHCDNGADAVTADPTDFLTACESAAIDNPPGGGGGGAPDATAPSLSGLNVGKVSRSLGGAFNYTLSEGASVTFTIEKQQLGRKVKKNSCKKQTKKNRKKKVCRYFVKVGTMRHQGNAGSNSAPFTAKLNGKPLKVGVYRLTAIAMDGAGNTSKPVRTTFVVLR